MYSIKLSLHKPNREKIGNLSEVEVTDHSIKLGQLNELSFKVPYKVERHSKIIDNPNVNKIKTRYLIKASYLNDTTEWYIIVEEEDILEGVDTKTVKAYSLGYQLSNKMIREWPGIQINGEFRKESLKLEEIVRDVLRDTNWALGCIDGIFLTRYREFDISNAKVLDVIFNVAEVYNALIEWDTINRKIHFYDTKDYGIYRDLTISDDKYLKSFKRVTDSNEVVTRLKVTGKDGLSINEVNPSGTDFIDDYTFLLQGFERDEDGTVVSPSPYLSDDLCTSLIAYSEFLESVQGVFESLLNNQESLNTDLITSRDELIHLEDELKAIQQVIDFNQTTGQDDSIALSEESQKLVEINSKKSELLSIEVSIERVNNDIRDFRDSIRMNKHFSDESLIELNDHIIENSWENTNISDPQELYDLALQEMEDLREVPTIYDIGIVDLFRLSEAEKDIEKIMIGSKIRVKKKGIKEIFEALVTELNINYSENDIGLVISDANRVKSDEDALAKLLYNSSSVNSTLDLNKNKWDDISNVGNAVNNILNNAWNSAQNEIVSGLNSEVVTDHRGVTVYNTEDSENFLRLNNSSLIISNRGKVNLAINHEGVFADVIVGRLIVGEELWIENDEGKYTINADGFTIQNNSFNLTSSNGGNGVTINANDGVVVTKSDDRVKTTLNATDGIKVEVKKGSTWYKEFYYDIGNERLVIDGEIHARDLKINGQSVITSGGKIDSFYVSDFSADRITAGTIDGNVVNVKNLNASNITAGTLNVENMEIISSDGPDRLVFDNNGLSSYMNDIITLQIDIGDGDFGRGGAVVFYSNRGDWSGALFSLSDANRLYMNTDTFQNFGNTILDGNLSVGGEITVRNSLIASQDWVNNKNYVSNVTLNNRLQNYTTESQVISLIQEYMTSQ